MDGVAQAAVLARLADPKILKALRKAPNVAPLVEEIARLRKSRDDVADFLAEGLIDRRRARKQLTDLNAKIDGLTRRRDALRRKSPVNDLALARSIPARWERLGVMERRRVISELGLRVVVDKTRPGRRPFDPRTVRLLWEDQPEVIAAVSDDMASAEASSEVA